MDCARASLGGSVPLRRLGRLEFYATCREPDLAVCVATGDNRLYANILLTVGYISLTVGYISLTVGYISPSS
jgi:L-fucose mutarotase/ribose pyranase (RbsD/FucU family)